MDHVSEQDASAGLAPTPEYEIEFPRHGALHQDEEWCLISENGTTREVRFHDYARIYERPGLYERLFHDHLKCSSPATVAGLLARELEQSNVDPRTLSALDFGAGNGMVGKQLMQIGAGTIIGVDILPQAAAAAGRDHPGVYDEYLVLDLTALNDEIRGYLESRALNALTCVAALGFGDIQPAGFAVAYDVVGIGGWLALSIREEFLQVRSGSGFARLIPSLLDRRMVEIRAWHRYRHRLSAAGEPVEYVAIVARKRSAERAAPLTDIDGGRALVT